tara:strand:+ start:147 stop:488 length:342 start_codon:yes stop_codon:yes gene_type:complete
MNIKNDLHKIVRNKLSYGQSIAEVAREYNVSRQYLHALLKKEMPLIKKVKVDNDNIKDLPINQRIKILRKNKGISQIQLCEQFNLHQPRLSALERNEQNSTYYEKIINYLESI